MASWIERGYPEEAIVSEQVECSSNGSVCISASYDIDGNGYVYTSSDSGATWTKRTGPGLNGWTVAVSRDGTFMVAGASASLGTAAHIWTSSDSGATWTERTASGTETWSRIVCSEDGEIIYACSSTTFIKSTDYGATWSTIVDTMCNDMACSSDGSVVIVSGYLAYQENIGITTDGGASWSVKTIGSLYSFDVAVTADGSTFVVTSKTSGGFPYLSTDDGATWTQLITDPFPYGTATSSRPRISDDAQTIIFWHPSGIYATYDGGDTWVWEQTNRSDWSMKGVFAPAMDSTGTKLVAPYLGTSGGGFFAWFTFEGTLPSEPSIVSIYPDNGPLAGGTSVTLRGTKLFQLADTSNIDFGANDAGYGTSLDNWIEYSVDSPAYETAGPVTVYYNSPDGTASYDFFTYTDFSIISITPNEGTTEGGTSVTVIGTGFTESTTITLDGEALIDQAFVDSETITGITPAHAAGAVDVVAENP
jgi:photosystem II stability/assembly factor-like uncharacterized protein